MTCEPSSLVLGETVSPARAAGLLPSVRVPWWVAGGLALDLFLARTADRTRISTSEFFGEIFKKCHGLEGAFRADGIAIVRKPLRAPQANRVAERFVAGPLSGTKAPRAGS